MKTQSYVTLKIYFRIQKNNRLKPNMLTRLNSLFMAGKKGRPKNAIHRQHFSRRRTAFFSLKI
ncbi:hypothetical protein BpHYR1_035694 [Brachionus plicatilis]|uniref:Uncharacterized protein n=1 Tax=Brachionus plicatilis TaxID=10195 RepID=A0A3M7QKZ6_BRAPC|nr:hypothetical protein BpHYR1_035694 [Brachionus plicatilis]